jgi:hypothetical protein
MTDWKTCARCACKDMAGLCASGWCSQLREEAEAALAGQAAAYNVLAERLDAKLAAATRYPHCDSEPDGLCLLEKAEARIAALEAENEALLDKGASDAIAIAALQDELRRPRATIREAMQ